MNENNQLTPAVNNLQASEINFTGSVQNVNPNATTVNNTTNNTFNRQETIIVIPDSTQPGGQRKAKVSHDYYNLFVLGCEDIPMDGRWSFNVDKDRAITEYTSDETKEKFIHLTDDVLPVIMTFPSLFLNENAKYGKADPDQYVRKGFITNIRKTDNGIRIDCYIREIFPQQLLNDYAHDFAIPARGGYSELNRTHWAVKQMDLELIMAEKSIEVEFGF